MANARFNQFMFTKHNKPVILDVDIPIGATGAVGTLIGGAGISSVVRNGTGVYQINLIDSYSKFLGMYWSCYSPNTGSDVLVASTGTTSGSTYTITTVGTTTVAGWVSLGLGIGITPAVGVVFKATATITATGTGAVQLVATAGSNVHAIECMGNPTTTINVTGLNAAKPNFTVVCFAATNSSTTTLIAADPASGSTIGLSVYLSDSSNLAKNLG